METSYVSAQAFSGADLMHGPMAMIDSAVPTIAVVSPGRDGDAMAPVLARLVNAEIGAATQTKGGARRGFVANTQEGRPGQ